ncbi:hypothetical protein [Pseudomonas oligotrophica]|uniref:hypothetical protein n=1 Tax=Pseudomonas oligotrophica TaxID=2912055 RepID=UPI001F3B9A1D|nr:hypothetical protein [Pseudomonas oligotrophica]MCF7202191.1 hypothetical protein [Pseudomonas oligotrophica]
MPRPLYLISTTAASLLVAVFALQFSAIEPGSHAPSYMPSSLHQPAPPAAKLFKLSGESVSAPTPAQQRWVF